MHGRAHVLIRPASVVAAVSMRRSPATAYRCRPLPGGSGQAGSSLPALPGLIRGLGLARAHRNPKRAARR
jgi:hypothetical protein